MNDYAALVEVTAPATAPISQSDAKHHLRVDTTADDNYIDDVIVPTAREYVEEHSLHALITQTWALVLDDWPDGDTIELPKPPLQAVNSVQYTDDDGATSTLASSKYVVDTDSTPGRLVLKRDESWPSDTLQEAAAIRIEFDAGFGDNPSDVPAKALAAMYLLIGHWYEHREAVITGTVPREIQFSVDALLANFRNKARRF